MNAPVTAVGAAYATLRGGDCGFREGLMVACLGTAAAANGPQDALTIGNTIIVDKGAALGDALLRHETKHADRWFLLGPVKFPILYGLDYGLNGKCGVFERWAGFEDGGYTSCL